MSSLNHLVIYLSGNCNLACVYCNFRANHFRQTVKEKIILKRIGFFLGRPHAGGKVTFLGGEPFLRWKLFKKAVKSIREKDPRIPVAVFTNGTLLEAEKMRFLRNNSVKLVLSLDGDEKTNDRFRKFINSGKSVFKSVIRTLKRCGFEDVTVNVVVTPETAGRLRKNVEFLRKTGFRSIGWNADYSRPWPQDSVEELKKQAAGIKLDYLKLLREEAELYELPNCYEIIDWLVRGKRAGCSNINLFPDGKFYFCDKIFPLKGKILRKFRIGFSKGMLNERKRRLFFRFLKRKKIAPKQLMCPAGIYLYYKFVKRLSGKKLEIALAGALNLIESVEAVKCSMIKDLLKYEPFRRIHGI